MATTIFFEESVKDQGGSVSMEIEVGRSSFYPEESLYIVVDGKTVVMSRATASKFVDAVGRVGLYLGLE